MTHHFENADLQISAWNVSTVRDSEKIQLWRIGNQPRVLKRAIDGVCALPLSSLKGGSKTDLSVFGNNTNCLGLFVTGMCVIIATKIDCEESRLKAFQPPPIKVVHCPLSEPSLSFSCQNEYWLDKNIKIAVENVNLCEKNMRYAHFAEICENAAIYEIWGNRIFA